MNRGQCGECMYHASQSQRCRCSCRGAQFRGRRARPNDGATNNLGPYTATTHCNCRCFTPLLLWLAQQGDNS